MPSDDSERVRRWKRFLVTLESFDKIAKRELAAELGIKGAKAVGWSFDHERAVLEVWYEREDFPPTQLGDKFPVQVIQLDPVIRIFH